MVSLTAMQTASVKSYRLFNFQRFQCKYTRGRCLTSIYCYSVCLKHIIIQVLLILGQHRNTTIATYHHSLHCICLGPFQCCFWFLGSRHGTRHFFNILHKINISIHFTLCSEGKKYFLNERNVIMKFNASVCIFTGVHLLSRRDNTDFKCLFISIELNLGWEITKPTKSRRINSSKDKPSRLLQLR